MRLLIVICSMLLICSCKKDEGEHMVRSIKVSDCLFAGDFVNFSPEFVSPYDFNGYKADQIKKVQWNFGDSSADAYTVGIVHVFNKPGTYTVTLMLNGQRVTKEVTINAPLSSPYTAAMARERHWAGTGRGQVTELHSTEYITDHDTVVNDLKLSVAVINDRTVQLQINTSTPLTLSSIDETAKTLTFTGCSVSRKLTYYYEKDSMTYGSEWAYGKRYGRLNLHTID